MQESLKKNHWLKTSVYTWLSLIQLTFRLEHTVYTVLPFVLWLFENWSNQYNCTCAQLCYDLKCLWLLTYIYITHIYYPLCFDSLTAKLQLVQIISCVQLCHALQCLWLLTYCPHLCKVSPMCPPAEILKEQNTGEKCGYQDPNIAMAYHGPTMARWGYYLKAIWQYSMWQYRANAGKVA